MKVSIRELKAHLSQYLAQAQTQGGEVIEVTSHRKVVARLVGVPVVQSPGVSRLLTAGAAEWQGGKPVGASIQLSGRGRPVSDLLLEDRG